jgi:hypothetical protein
VRHVIAILVGIERWGTTFERVTVWVFGFEQVIYLSFSFGQFFSLCALNTPARLRHVEHAGKIIPQPVLRQRDFSPSVCLGVAAEYGRRGTKVLPHVCAGNARSGKKYFFSKKANISDFKRT